MDDFHRQRIAIENTLDEHRIQRDILFSRTGAEFYRSIARDLIELYLLIRNSNMILKIPLQWFIEMTTKNLSSRRMEFNAHSSTENVDQIHRVQSRECYLRCFQSICSYLSLSLSDRHWKSLLLFFALIEENSLDYLRLFQTILQQFHPINRQIVPEFLDDPKRPDFLSSHSWLLCQSSLIERKFPNLSQHLIDYEHQWKEYLFSSNKFDFINSSPLETTTNSSILDRFLLGVILRPDQVRKRKIFSSQIDSIHFV